MDVTTESTKFIYRGKTVEFFGYVGDHIFEKVRRTQVFYETDLLEYVRFVCANKKRASVALDVGANIGNHSTYFGLFVADRVLAFEPNPLTHTALEKNLQTNIETFQIFRCGLGAEAGTASVSADFSSGRVNIGASRLQVSEAGYDKGNVLVRTLDGVLSDENITERVDLIKIDVEGMEVSVLEGARETLEAFHPELFIEAATADAKQTLIATLRPMGYQVMSRWAATPVYHFSHEPTLRERIRWGAYRTAKKPVHLLKVALGKR